MAGTRRWQEPPLHPGFRARLGPDRRFRREAHVRLSGTAERVVLLIWRGAAFVLGACRKPRSSRSRATLPDSPTALFCRLARRGRSLPEGFLNLAADLPARSPRTPPELRGNCTGYGRRARIRSAILIRSDSERLGGDQRTPLPRNRRGARDFPGPFISAKTATPNAHSCCSDHWCHAPEALTPFSLGHLAWRRLGQYGGGAV
jgi:hypothetical protein